MRYKLAASTMAALLLTLSTPLSLANTKTDDRADNKKPTWDVNKPLGEFKQANIDVDEGTWMNLDVSPDGQTIAFDLLGDIYTLAIEGGEATALMQDIAWQMQPRFSPDGKHITFTSDQGGGDNIWTMRTDGSEQTAVTDETFRLLNSPAWSPDGDYIVARKHFTGARSLGAGEVWMYHKSGGKGIMLTKRPNEQKDLGEPAFSPDGQYIYFSQDATPGKTFHYSKDSEQGIYKIKRLERDTGKITVLVEGRGGAVRPTPSPDGKTLAYIARDDFQTSLFLLNLETGEKRKAYAKLERDMQETWAIHGVYPNISWTPDNKHLIFWAAGKIHQLTVETGQEKIIPFRIKTSKKIQTTLRFKQDIDNEQFDVKMLRNVQVSPNGKQIVFEALGHIYTRSLINDQTMRVTRQTEDFELNPRFSRDGKKIVYTTWHDQQQGSVRIVSASGGKGRTISANPGKYVEPSFSPDGKTVVYRKIEGGYITAPAWGLNPGLYTVNSKGGTPQRISEHGIGAHYASSNERVYFTIPGEQQKLVSIDLDTKKKRALYQSKLATEFRVSPDAKYLAFAERFNVFVTPFSQLGQSITTGPDSNALPVKKLSLRAGENISWTKDSDALYWSLGNDLYQAPLAGLFEIKPPIDKQDSDEEKQDENDENNQADKNQQNKPVDITTKTNIAFKQKRDKPQGSIAFVNARVITMDNDAVLEGATVVVTNNKIVAVGNADQISIPADAKRIDLDGKTLMPGLIDAHAHGPQASSEIIPQQNWKNYAGLSLGVTTIHDPSHDTSEFFAASELQKSGAIVAPRLFSTGSILYGAKIAGYTSHVDSLEDAKFHLLRQKQAGAFSVKSYNQPRRNQRQQIVQAARELKMMVVPEGGSLLQHNLTMLVDGHTTLEHSIPAANIYNDVKQLWQASAMAYTPTLIVAYGGIWGEHYWYDKTDVWQHPRLSKYVPADILAPRAMRRSKAPDHHYNHINVAKTAKTLNDQGVLTNIGAHGQREGLGAHWELWMYAQGGMTPMQALKTATINPAKTLGLDDMLGSISVGKLADLIVIDGNPLDNIRLSDRIEYVMINGRLYNGETMNEIGNYNKERKKFYFEK